MRSQAPRRRRRARRGRNRRERLDRLAQTRRVDRVERAAVALGETLGAGERLVEQFETAPPPLHRSSARSQ